MIAMITLRLITVALLLTLLQGCATAIIGGAAGGVAVVHDRRTAGTLVEDQQIELNMFNFKRQDAELKTYTDIYSTSYNRQLLLSGTAATRTLANKVVNHARTITGVRQVFNEIEIHPEGTEFQGSINDTYITSKVKLALLKVKLKDFDPSRVKATTYNGSVYLMGLVTRQEGNAAAEQVRQVSGVKRVVKYFEYISKPPSNPAQNRDDPTPAHPADAGLLQ
jgi:osmotically-inducible protein OsmY